jgi:predicted metalloprotease
MYRLVDKLHPRHAIVAIAVLVSIALPARVAGVGVGPDPRPEITRFEPFPDAVVAHAPALPQYADGSATRVTQQLASIDAMWAAAFADADDEYDKPKLVGEMSGACKGEPPPNWAGVYCDATQELTIDHVSHLRRHNATGGGLADLVLGYIVAHEVGHHVQSVRGAPSGTLGITIKRELHAECLAGVWGKAAGLPAPPAWFYASDPTHGTALQQSQWLNEGYRHGRPADCNAVWETPL